MDVRALSNEELLGTLKQFNPADFSDDDLLRIIKEAPIEGQADLRATRNIFGQPVRGVTPQESQAYDVLEEAGYIPSRAGGFASGVLGKFFTPEPGAMEAYQQIYPGAAFTGKLAQTLGLAAPFSAMTAGVVPAIQGASMLGRAAPIAAGMAHSALTGAGVGATQAAIEGERDPLQIAKEAGWSGLKWAPLGAVPATAIGRTWVAGPRITAGARPFDISIGQGAPWSQYFSLPRAAASAGAVGGGSVAVDLIRQSPELVGLIKEGRIDEVKARLGPIATDAVINALTAAVLHGYRGAEAARRVENERLTRPSKYVELSDIETGKVDWAGRRTEFEKKFERPAAIAREATIPKDVTKYEIGQPYGEQLGETISRVKKYQAYTKPQLNEAYKAGEIDYGLYKHLWKGVAPVAPKREEPAVPQTGEKFTDPNDPVLLDHLRTSLNLSSKQVGRMTGEQRLALAKAPWWQQREMIKDIVQGKSKEGWQQRLEAIKELQVTFEGRQAPPAEVTQPKASVAPITTPKKAIVESVSAPTAKGGEIEPNYTRSFLNETQAQKFANKLENAGGKTITIQENFIGMIEVNYTDPSGELSHKVGIKPNELPPKEVAKGGEIAGKSDTKEGGDFRSLAPGTPEWKSYWKAHPEQQEEMLKYQKEGEKSIQQAIERQKGITEKDRESYKAEGEGKMRAPQKDATIKIPWTKEDITPADGIMMNIFRKAGDESDPYIQALEKKGKEEKAAVAGKTFEKPRVSMLEWVDKSPIGITPSQTMYVTALLQQGKDVPADLIHVLSEVVGRGEGITFNPDTGRYEIDEDFQLPEEEVAFYNEIKDYNKLPFAVPYDVMPVGTPVKVDPKDKSPIGTIEDVYDDGYSLVKLNNGTKVEIETDRLKEAKPSKKPSKKLSLKEAAAKRVAERPKLKKEEKLPIRISGNKRIEVSPEVYNEIMEDRWVKAAYANVMSQPASAMGKRTKVVKAYEQAVEKKYNEIMKVSQPAPSEAVAEAGVEEEAPGTAGLLEEIAELEGIPAKEEKPYVPSDKGLRPAKVDTTKINNAAQEQFGKDYDKLTVTEKRKLLDLSYDNKQVPLPEDEILRISKRNSGHDVDDRRNLMIDRAGKYITDGRYLIIDESTAKKIRDAFWAKEEKSIAKDAAKNMGLSPKEALEFAKEKVAKDRAEKQELPPFEKVIPTKIKQSDKIRYTGSGYDKALGIKMSYTDGTNYGTFKSEYIKMLKELLPDTEMYAAKIEEGRILQAVFMKGGEIKAVLMGTHDEPIKEIKNANIAERDLREGLAEGGATEAEIEDEIQSVQKSVSAEASRDVEGDAVQPVKPGTFQELLDKKIASPEDIIEHIKKSVNKHYPTFQDKEDLAQDTYLRLIKSNVPENLLAALPAKLEGSDIEKWLNSSIYSEKVVYQEGVPKTTRRGHLVNAYNEMVSRQRTGGMYGRKAIEKEKKGQKVPEVTSISTEEGEKPIEAPVEDEKILEDAELEAFEKLFKGKSKEERITLGSQIADIFRSKDTVADIRAEFKKMGVSLTPETILKMKEAARGGVEAKRSYVYADAIMRAMAKRIMEKHPHLVDRYGLKDMFEDISDEDIIEASNETLPEAIKGSVVRNVKELVHLFEVPHVYFSSYKDTLPMVHGIDDAVSLLREAGDDINEMVWTANKADHKKELADLMVEADRVERNDGTYIDVEQRIRAGIKLGTFSEKDLTAYYEIDKLRRIIKNKIIEMVLESKHGVRVRSRGIRIKAQWRNANDEINEKDLTIKQYADKVRRFGKDNVESDGSYELFELIRMKKGQAVKELVRADSYEDLLNKKKELEDEIAREILKYKNWVPHSRKGGANDYWIQVWEKPSGEFELLSDEEKERLKLWSARVPSEAVANRMLAAFEKKYAYRIISDIHKHVETVDYGRFSLGSLLDVQFHLMNLGIKPTSKDFQRIVDAYKAISPILESTMHASNVPGYKTDFTSILDAIKAKAFAASRRTFRQQVVNLYDMVREVKDPWRKNMADLYLKALTDFSSNKSSKIENIFRAVNTIGYMKALANSVTYLLSNLTEPLWAHLSAFSEMKSPDMPKYLAPLTAEEKALVKEAQDRGLIKTRVYEESKVWSAVRSIDMLGRTSEEHSSKEVFASGLRMARVKGLTGRDAYDFARHWLFREKPFYHEANRLILALGKDWGFVRRHLFFLMSWSINWINKFARGSIKKKLLWLLGLTFLAGIGRGLPGGRTLLNKLGLVDKDPRKWTWYERYLVGGIFGLMGLDPAFILPFIGIKGFGAISYFMDQMKRMWTTMKRYGPMGAWAGAPLGGAERLIYGYLRGKGGIPISPSRKWRPKTFREKFWTTLGTTPIELGEKYARERSKKAKKWWRKTKKVLFK